MEDLVLINTEVIAPESPGSPVSVYIRDGCVFEIGGTDNWNCRVLDLDGARLFPGFIDIHCHGAAGVDVNSASAEEIAEVSGFLARHGVTSWLPTVVPDSDERYRTASEAVAGYMSRQARSNGARALGVHYEGPFVSELKCGALRKEHIRTYSDGAVRCLPAPAGSIRMMTFAPEIPGGPGLVRELTSDGWIAAIGHTAASVDELDAAFGSGARHLTHFFNAMSGLHHRTLGVVGWGLTRKDVTFDLIADGNHVHPDLVRTAIAAKGTGNSILISDSISPTGLGEGEYELWGKRISVCKNRATDSSGTISGSVITLLDAVNFCINLGFRPSEAAAMASANPARLLGIDGECGSIEPGKRADLVAVRDDRAVLTLVGGRIVHSDL